MKFSLAATLLAFVMVAQAAPTGLKFRRQSLAEELSRIDEQICALRQLSCEVEGAAVQKTIDDNFQKFRNSGNAGPRSNPVLKEGNQFVTNGKSFNTAEEAIVQSCTDQMAACLAIKDLPDFPSDDTPPSPEQCDRQQNLCLAQDEEGVPANFQNPVACAINFDSCVERSARERAQAVRSV